MRPPRWLEADGLVRPYSKFKAEGYKLLRDLDKVYLTPFKLIYVYKNNVINLYNYIKSFYNMLTAFTNQD